MSRMAPQLGRAGIPLGLTVSLLALAGCSTTSTPAPVSILEPGITIQGRVHGGAYPITNATVRLMETQANGYGGAAKQLTATQSNSLGYFSFDNYAGCDSGQFVYVTVSGGQTISGEPNNNVVQVGVIGSCSVDLANPQNVNLFVSELSTVAAAYALGNFLSMSPNDSSGQQIVNISAPPNNYATGGCSGSGTTGRNALACTGAGLANGFANAYNLVDSVRYDGSFPTGQANSTLPGGANRQAVVPQAMLDTLGNILQSCVDSGGVSSSLNISATSSDGSQCGNLFEQAATPAGTVPQNTLQVALNMAKYPTHNVVNLFNLQPRQVFFTPTLSSSTMSDQTTPIAFTVSIFYEGTGISGDTGMPYPADVALDGNDNAYVLFSADKTATGWTALDGFAPNGGGLFAGAHLPSISNPTVLAVDSLGYAWTGDDSAGGQLYGLYTNGTAATNGTIFTSVSVPNGYPAGVAVDASNGVWISRDSMDGNQSLYRFAPSTGSTYKASAMLFAPALRASAKRIVADRNGNLWGTTSGTTGSAVAFTFPYGSSGTLALLGSASLSSSGGFGVAITNATTAYFPLAGELDSASGGLLGSVAANNAGSYTGISGSGVPGGTAIDGAGNVFWTDFEVAGKVYMTAPSTGTGAVTTKTLSKATLIAFTPCFEVSLVCDMPKKGTWLRGMAIDSSGAMWYVSDGPDFAVAQTLGLAAPTYPLLSYAHAAVTVQ